MGRWVVVGSQVGGGWVGGCWFLLPKLFLALVGSPMMLVVVFLKLFACSSPQLVRP